MDTKLIFIATSLIALTGCSTSGIKNDITTTTTTKPDGSVEVVVVDKSKTGGDIAAMQLALALQGEKAKTLESVAMMDDEAQRYLAIRGDMWTDEYASYIRGEIAEGQQIKDGVSGGIWGVVGLAGVYGTASVMKSGVENAGDTYTVGNISQQKSDDPYGGGGTGGAVNGSAGINIGSGNLSSDRSQLNDRVDKAINTPLTGDSNFDEVQSGAQGGIIIDDANDGSDNEASLF